MIWATVHNPQFRAALGPESAHSTGGHGAPIASAAAERLTRIASLGTRSAMSQSCIWTTASWARLPILVVKERDTRMTCSMLEGEKGAVDEHVIKRIIAVIKEHGYESAKIVWGSVLLAHVR